MPPKKRKLSVQTSDIPKRKSLRLAAKSIKSTPEPEQIVYEKLTLTLADDGHAVYVEIIKDPKASEEWEFEPTRDGCKIRNLQDHSEKQVEGKSFIRAAVEQCAKILKTPNLHLKKLVIDLESPESVCRKLEAAHKMFHPEDKEFKCKPPECIKTLYRKNSRTLKEVLEKELNLFKFELSVECFEMEFDGFSYQVSIVLSALQPKTLKKIVINSDCLYSEDNELVTLEQWKRAKRLECYSRASMDVEHWKYFETVDIELGILDKEDLDKILNTFLFVTSWERISMQFGNYKLYRADYFEKLDIPDTTVIPGIVDNWVINVSKMNHKVFVIFSEGTLHLMRKHWPANRKKKVAIRRKFRKAEAVLAEMPDCRKIVEHLDEMSKRSIRQTCRVFNNIVKTSGSTYEKLTLTLADNRPAIFVELYIDAENRLELEFEQDPLGYTVKNPQEGWEQTVIYNQYRHGLMPQFDFIGAAVQHFFKIFTKRTVVKKLCLVTEDPSKMLCFIPNSIITDDTYDIAARLSINHSWNLRQLTKKLLDCLAKNQHSLKVKHFECCFADSVYTSELNHTLHVLKFLDPKFLDRITISGELSEEEVQRVLQFETCRSVKEFCSYSEIPATMWTHFPKSEIHCDWVTVGKLEALLNTLHVSSTWISVLITCGYLDRDARAFLDRLEDQRPVESRIEHSKLIRIANVPNQFINYQLIGRNNISFTRVIQ